jgi:hypothetical protein
MDTTPLTNIAPEIFRKRLLVEGYFKVEVTEDSLRSYFSRITSELGLRTYGEPIIHMTSGEGKDINEGSQSMDQRATRSHRAEATV